MDIERILQKTLKPALGCTEPVAISLAVAAAVMATEGWSPDHPHMLAKDLSAEDVASVRVAVNKGVFKNAFSVYIPNAQGDKGILMASALGCWCDPGLGLELFRNLTAEDVARARRLIEENKVAIEIVPAEHTDLYIAANVRIRNGAEIREGASVIMDEHTNLVRLTCNGKEIFRRDSSPRDASDPVEDLQEFACLRFEDLVRLMQDIPESSYPLLRKTIDMNRKAAETGLERPLGLGVGFLAAQFPGGLDKEANLAHGAAAGSDARMSGHPIEVMSSAGSGNQGMIATIPVYAYCRANGVDELPMLRATALSHLVTLYVTVHVGYLSSLCGVAIKAGIGAACGLTYAMGGGATEVQRAVKIMAAALSGVICDGAKPGCALKVSSAADMAARAASLAMQNVEVSDENGIVADTAENTIRNLKQLNQSMQAAEEKIIQIMQEKIMPRPSSETGLTLKSESSQEH
jgi:L-cysteine desulfidase